MNGPLTENERSLALAVAEREGGETKKWLNLVLLAYDGAEARNDELTAALRTLIEVAAHFMDTDGRGDLDGALDAARAALAGSEDS